MSNIALSFENVSKCYRLGLPDRPLREVISDAVMRPHKLVQRMRERQRRAKTQFWALKDVSFDVKQGEVVGVIGRNGAGKSTLLKILSRITLPTNGTIRGRGRVASLLEVGTGFHPELTGRENIYLNGAVLGMSRREIKAKFDEIVAFAEVEKFLETPVKRYSSGMQVRLAFAVAAHLDPDVLVADEVLAVGDAEFQRKCLGKMQEVASTAGRTVLFVSHNMASIVALCTRGIVLNKGTVGFDGNVESAVAAYQSFGGSKGQARSLLPHILFEATPEELAGHSHIVTRVEQLDLDGKPKPVISTWDPVMYRVHYRSEAVHETGAVELEFSGFDGTRILLFTTSPEGGRSLRFVPGEHYVDLIIPKFPLSGGEYFLGVATATPYVEYLWRNSQAARVQVTAKDVFECHYAPISTRMLVPVEHEWRGTQLGELRFALQEA